MQTWECSRLFNVMQKLYICKMNVFFFFFCPLFLQHLLSSLFLSLSPIWKWRAAGAIRRHLPWIRWRPRPRWVIETPEELRGGNYSGAEWLFPLHEARDEAAPVIQLNNRLRTVRGINLGDKTLCNSIVGFLVLWLSSVITWSSYVMRLLTGHRLLSIFKGNGIMWWLHTHTHTNQHTDVIFS